jgi:hypothetical protein
VILLASYQQTKDNDYDDDDNDDDDDGELQGVARALLLCEGRVDIVNVHSSQ